MEHEGRTRKLSPLHKTSDLQNKTNKLEILSFELVNYQNLSSKEQIYLQAPKEIRKT